MSVSTLPSYPLIASSGFFFAPQRVIWRFNANRQFPVGRRSESKRRERASNATVFLRRPRPAQLGGNTSRREPAHAPKSTWAAGSQTCVVLVLAGRNIRASDQNFSPALDDIKVHVKLKLFALWSSVMFCYTYGDFFGLFKTGALQAMISGRTPVGAVSEGVLLGMSISMAIPQQHGVSIARFTATFKSLDEHHLSTTVLVKRSATKKTTRELSEQNSCDGLSKRSNGPGAMPLHAYRASPEGGT